MKTRRTLAVGAVATAVLGPVSYLLFLLPDGESTRLISRNRIETKALAPASRLFYLLLMEPGSLVMERKMLLGIKHRAEGTAQQAGR